MSDEYIPSSVKLHTSDECKWSKIKICGFAFVTGFVMALFIAAWLRSEDIEKVTRIRFNEGWMLGSNNVQAGAIIRGFGYRTNKVFVWHKNLEAAELQSRQDVTTGVELIRDLKSQRTKLYELLAVVSKIGETSLSKKERDNMGRKQFDKFKKLRSPTNGLLKEYGDKELSELFMNLLDEEKYDTVY